MMPPVSQAPVTLHLKQESVLITAAPVATVGELLPRAKA
jgi:hypothetical protein